MKEQRAGRPGEILIEHNLVFVIDGRDRLVTG